MRHRSAIRRLNNFNLFFEFELFVELEPRLGARFWRNCIFSATSLKALPVELVTSLEPLPVELATSEISRSVKGGRHRSSEVEVGVLKKLTVY